MVRTIVITGASRGIGLEFVKQYSSQPDTQTIAVVRNLGTSANLQELAKTNDRIQIVQADVADEASINAAAQQITKISDGVVDLLINNAAIFTNPELELTDETAQGLEHEFHVNVTGPILFTNAILPLLKSSDEKRVVFLSSMAGSLSLAGPDSWPMTFPGSTYNITKVALIMATRKYAVQFKDAGFTFVSIHPGWVQTDMGGKGAILTTEESVGSMNKVFESLSPKDNGRFLDYDGKDFAF